MARESNWPLNPTYWEVTWKKLKKAVTGAGAEAAGIERGPTGAERLVIRTLGGLITIGVPLKGELSTDIENATAAANKHRGADQCDMRERLRKISHEPSSPRIILLLQQSNIITKG